MNKKEQTQTDSNKKPQKRGNKMLPVERRDRLIALLQERKTATTEELAAALEVSVMTVRRDLEFCQKEGRIQRCHGGAVISRKTVLETSFDQKMTAGRERKKALAKLAAELVKPGMTVYLDAGTSTYAIAEELESIEKLTVITNDLKIAIRMLSTTAETVVLGGKVQKRTGSMIGGTTLEQMSNLRASIAFVGAASIDENLATLTPTQEKVALKRSIHKIAQQTYLVVDASKFNSSALYFVDHLMDYDGVITDALLTESERRLLGKKTRLITP